MPAIDHVAKFEPLQPGSAKFTLNRFNALKSLGPQFKQRIDLIVVRRNEAHLADWFSPAADGFLSIIPKNANQRAMDFEFEVGPEVVNPMAFDNSGDYILRIRDVNGIIVSFSVAMQGMPKADSMFIPKNSAAFHATAATAQQAQAAQRAAAAQQAQAQAAAAEGFTAPGLNANTNPFGSPGAVGTSGGNPFGAAGTAADAAAAGGSKSGLIGKIVAAIVVLALLGGIGGYFGGFFGGEDATVAEVQEESSTSETAQDEEQSGSDSKPEQATAQNAGSQQPGHQGLSGIANGSGLGGGSNSGSVAANLTADQACHLAGNTGSDQAIISGCLNAKPTADQLNNLIRDAMQNNRCEIAVKILSSKGRSPNGGNYAYVYALMSDPNVRGGSSCIVKRTEDANYWYETAKKDPNFNKKEAIKMANFFVM